MGWKPFFRRTTKRCDGVALGSTPLANFRVRAWHKLRAHGRAPNSTKTLATAATNRHVHRNRNRNAKHTCNRPKRQPRHQTTKKQPQPQQQLTPLQRPPLPRQPPSHRRGSCCNHQRCKPVTADDGYHRDGKRNHRNTNCCAATARTQAATATDKRFDRGANKNEAFPTYCGKWQLWGSNPRACRLAP